MTCDECFEAFSASADGELTGDDLEAMNEHLDDCADCQRLRGRLLSLSAEMKAQPFLEPSTDQVRALAATVLSVSAPTSGWGVLRRLLRAPYESWPWRHGLRLTAYGGMSLLVVLAAIARWLLPPYTGLEAAPRRGLPDSVFWSAWAPGADDLFWASLAVLVVALWTGGLPALLSDLEGEVRLTPYQVATAAAGLAMAGPFVALPLLAGLELGAFVLVCCFWVGLCLLGGFALIAFKTARPLPRLALDFVMLVLPLGVLEWSARASLGLPRAQDCQPTIALLVGSLPFSVLLACLGVAALSAGLLGSGVAGALPSYRGGRDGQWPSFLLLLAGLGCLGYGLAKVVPRDVVSPSRAELVDGRRAYLLASVPNDPWLLPSADYPRLEVNVAGPGVDPRAARLRVASAYLEWDEEKLLVALRSWADKAPGVAWGLSAFLDSLGRREGAVLTLPSEPRQQLVAHLLGELRWRVLAQAVLSSHSGSVSGQIEGVAGRREGLRLRLIEVPDGQPEQALIQLTGEAAWAREMVDGDDLDPDFRPPFQRTVSSGVDGEFELTRIPPGRYLLALLDAPATLTDNPTIPGVFEVKAGRLRLAPIKLSQGSEGEPVPLVASRWQAQGEARFRLSGAGPRVDLGPDGSISAVLDSRSYSSGSVRLKLLLDGSSEGRGLLRIRLLSKDGRVQGEQETEVRASDHTAELRLSERNSEGYLQITVLGQQGLLGLSQMRLEVTP